MLNNIQNRYSFKNIYKKKIKTLKFNFVKYGIVGIRALESGSLTPKQLESIRRILVRVTKRTGKFWLRVHVDQPKFKKAQNSRMGKGKGSINLWVADVKAGQIILEFFAANTKLILNIFNDAKNKLPMSSELVFKDIHYKHANN